VLFEEFLEQELAASRAALTLGAGPSTILLHAHCHQRSMALAAPATALLSRIPGATVTDLDAGCCGMAGSFGYAVEHYDVSRAIGERKLLRPRGAYGRRRAVAGDFVPASGRAFHRRPPHPAVCCAVACGEA
jgi:Fe-S oxidoreductase